MKKKGDYLLGKVLIVLLLFSSIGTLTFFYAYGANIFDNNDLTGMSIRALNAFVDLTPRQKTVLYIEFSIAFLILLFIFVGEFKGKKIRKMEITSEDIKIHSKSYGTELDILYDILKRKKKIHLSSISKAFKINKEITMEWCKTLESSNLGSIEYPALGEPYIKL